MEKIFRNNALLLYLRFDVASQLSDEKNMERNQQFIHAFTMYNL